MEQKGYIVWSKDKINLKDPFQRKWYIKQTLTYGRTEDIAQQKNFFYIFQKSLIVKKTEIDNRQNAQRECLLSLFSLNTDFSRFYNDYISLKIFF